MLSAELTKSVAFNLKAKFYLNIKLHIHQLIMMTSSNGNIFRVTGPLCGEITGPGDFPTQRPVTRGFAVFFDLRLNKRLSKQPWGWWFETPAWSLWRHRNGSHINTTQEGAPEFISHSVFVWQFSVVIPRKIVNTLGHEQHDCYFTDDPPPQSILPQNIKQKI